MGFVRGEGRRIRESGSQRGGSVLAARGHVQLPQGCHPGVTRLTSR